VGPALHWLSMIQQHPKSCQRPNGSDASPETRIFSEKAWCQEVVGWIHSHHKLYLSKVVYRLRVVHLYICIGMINVSQAYAVESDPGIGAPSLCELGPGCLQWQLAVTTHSSFSSE
jgi:hypothetical protein